MCEVDCFSPIRSFASLPLSLPLPLPLPLLRAIPSLPLNCLALSLIPLYIMSNIEPPLQVIIEGDKHNIILHDINMI